MLFGLILALASAVGTNAAFLLKARGAVAAPPVIMRHPLHSAAGLFASRGFALGWVVAVIAWLLHVGALRLAPLSIVQAVLSGGLVLLAVLAERWFGLRLERRQIIGLLVTGVGLAVIGVTSGGSSHPPHASLAALISVECSILAGGAALVGVSTHRHVSDRAESLILGIAAGALFGVSDVAIKYLTHASGPMLGLISPWTLSAVLAAVISFYASARSLQIGQAVDVIALTSVAANLVAVLGGILVFHDPVGSGAAGVAGRMLAFAFVIFGAAMMPAPLRITPEADPQAQAQVPAVPAIGAGRHRPDTYRSAARP